MLLKKNEKKFDIFLNRMQLFSNKSRLINKTYLLDLIFKEITSYRELTYIEDITLILIKKLKKFLNHG